MSLQVPVLGHRVAGLGPLVERQGRFAGHLALVDDCLQRLVKEALDTR